VETTEQADQSEKMVAVQMGNKNVVDSRKLDFAASQLLLSAFTTINQEIMLAHLQ
jgi:hypothetical protein